MVSDQRNNLFKNRLVENVSTIQLIAFFRTLCILFFFIFSPSLGCVTFSAVFSNWIRLFIFVCSLTLKYPSAFSIFYFCVCARFLCLWIRAHVGVNCADKQRRKRFKKLFCGIGFSNWQKAFNKQAQIRFWMKKSIFGMKYFYIKCLEEEKNTRKFFVSIKNSIVFPFFL